MDLSLLEKELKLITDNRIILFNFRTTKTERIHNYLFPKDYMSISELNKNKEKIIKDITQKNENLLKIQNKNSKTDFSNIIDKEINYILLEHDILIKTYDIEAYKLNKEYKIKDPKLDYDYYNEKLYGITKQEIKQIKIKEPKNNTIDKFVSKTDINKLFKITKEFFPEINYKFGNYSNFSALENIIHIPNRNKYNVRELITIFFHEMTHIIRTLNAINNMGFKYTFCDNRRLEEGLALYNEYYYGNQIYNIGEYYPYYNKVYQILMTNKTKEEKIEMVYNLLSTKKNTTKRHAYFYIKRAYRFAQSWGKDFLLKETIYNTGYKKVNNLLKEGYDLNYLMSIKGNTDTLKAFIKKDNINNLDYEDYFKKMVKEIKRLF